MRCGSKKLLIYNYDDIINDDVIFNANDLNGEDYFCIYNKYDILCAPSECSRYLIGSMCPVENQSKSKTRENNKESSIQHLYYFKNICSFTDR